MTNFLIIENQHPTLLAWCSKRDNKINVVDLNTKQKIVSFYGAQLKPDDSDLNITKFDIDIHILPS